MVDADYKFLYVDVGCTGRISNGGVFRHSPLSSALENNDLNVPKESMGSLPYVVVADDAFPLKRYLMKPYTLRNLSKEKIIFNYRLNNRASVLLKMRLVSYLIVAQFSSHLGLLHHKVLKK